MKFTEPNALYLIWLVPLAVFLFWWSIRRRRRILRGFARKETLVRILRGPDTQPGLYRAALSASAILFITVALAGPLYGYRWRTVERKGVDIVVALDVSRSMLAEDVKPNRLEQAKREVIDLLNRLEGDRVGLVAFAGTAFLQCPLTVDYAGFYLFLNALTPEFLPVGGTALEDALDTALAGFDPKSPAERVIIVLTDGQPTQGDTWSAVDRAAEAGVVLHVIGMGTPGGAPIPEPGGGFKKDDAGHIVLSRLEEEVLRRVATRAGGLYTRATLDDADWDLVYEREIRGKMEARPIGDNRTRVWENRYQWPLGLALILLAAEFFIPLRGSRAKGRVLLALLVLMGPSAVEAAGASGYVREGISHYESGDYASALQSFTRAQVEDPDVPEASYNVGSAQYKTGEYDSALRNFEAAARSEDPGLKTRSLFNLGNTQYRLGRLEESVKRYEEVLELVPQDEEARKNLEFVRKQIQEMKQEKPEQSGGSDERRKNEGTGNDQAKESQDQDRGTDGELAEEGPASQQMNETDGGETGQEKKGTGQERAESANEEADRVSSRRAEPDRPMDPGQGERLLNRLEDRPGRALLPAYRKRRVEKDW